MCYSAFGGTGLDRFGRPEGVIGTTNSSIVVPYTVCEKCVVNSTPVSTAAIIVIFFPVILAVGLASVWQENGGKLEFQ